MQTIKRAIFDTRGFLHINVANNENFKTFDSVKSTLQRRKSKLRPKLPNSLKDMKIEAINFFKNEELYQTVRNHSANSTNAPPRKKLYIIKDESIKSFKDLLSSNEITLEIYIKRVLPLFELDKKKKAKEAIISSDESESEVDCDDSDDSDEN
ncbi:unnamed protein product [Brachionus calyciflorus]|uniref:Uncharacterized protein n=1 Tax=Brachionus calyciflorus TaxID=104777 RepID=A0A814RT55_9BILA|nr:unnamed protein product [Brachionus calyciflorus]